MSATSSTDKAAAFSYAQAAKGVVAPNGTATVTSQTTSGSSTPMKDVTVLAESHTEFGTATSTSGRSIADEGEVKVTGSNADSFTANDVVPATPASEAAETAPKSVTVEVEKRQTGRSSEDSWRKNARDNSDKPESSERSTRRKGRKQKSDKKEEKEAEREKSEPKVVENFVEAAIPVVNIWAVRAQTVKPKPAAAEKTEPSNSTPTEAKTEKKDVKPAKESEKAASTSQASGKDARNQRKGPEAAQNKDTARRGAPRGSRTAEKDEKAASSQLPPPVHDAVSWPTPETAVEEDKRKAQEKVEKEVKDEETSVKQPRQKKEWVSVPYTPTVTFNTPLPPRGARGRGGRPGGRESGGRTAGTSGGSVNGDKPAGTAEKGTEQRGRHRDSTSSRASSLPPTSSKKSGGDSGTKDTRKASIALERGKTDLAQLGKLEAGATPKDRRTSFASHTTEKNIGAQGESSRPQKHEGQSAGDAHSHPQAAHDASTARTGEFSKEQARHTQSHDRGERSERGRGGYRRGGYGGNQQHGPHVYTNGHGQHQANGFGGMRANTVPYSPPGQQGPFQNNFQQSGRRGPPRAQSIPNNFQPRYQGQMMPMMPLQTGAPFDPAYMQPMTAGPYSPYGDQYSVLGMVQMQLEYYFSIDNLCKDVFLRKHMDSQGFVFLTFIAGFKRIQQLTQDFELLRYACQESEVIEIVVGEDGIDRLRRRDGWEKWVLPTEDRDESAKNDGPAKYFRQSHPPRPQGSRLPVPQMSPPMFQPMGFPAYSMAPPTANGNENGYGQHHDSPLSATVPDFSPRATTPSNIYADVPTAFQDEEIPALTVLYTEKSANEPALRPFYPNGASRTFSNGSIDARIIADELQELEKRRSRSPGQSGSEEM
jgi:la-related protein 1